MTDKISGSCLCNSVKYIIDSDIKSVVNCHCNTCKKITGGAFETIAIIAESDLIFTEGKENLTVYQITANAKKHFCRNCGTPIFNLHNKYPRRCMVSVGSFDDPATVAPAINIFCESMLPWVDKIGELTSFDQLPTA